MMLPESATWVLNCAGLDFSSSAPFYTNASGASTGNNFHGNWHGDVSTYTNVADSNGSTDMALYPPWGNYQYGTKDYYRWNGMWGYQWYGQFGLYYVHGRWYNPDIARFLSPDEKGDYRYGSDGVNWVREQTIASPNDQPAWRQVAIGALYQIAKNNADAIKLPAIALGVIPAGSPSLAWYDNQVADIEARLPDTYLTQVGRAFGSTVTILQGIGEIGNAGTIGGMAAVATCAVLGPETELAGCGAAPVVGVAVTGGALIHGLALEGVSWTNGQQIAASFMAGKGRGNEWRPLGVDDLPSSYQPPKGGPRKVTVQDGPYRGRSGWLDKDGNIWVPSRPGESHGGPHWDVQINGGKDGHTNVNPK